MYIPVPAITYIYAKNNFWYNEKTNGDGTIYRGQNLRTIS